MQATLHRRHKIIIILLSLLINLLLLLPLILMKLDQVTQEALVFFQPEPDDALSQAQPEPEELIQYILSSGAIPAATDREFQEDVEPQDNPMLTQAQPGAQLEQEASEEIPPAPEEPEQKTDIETQDHDALHPEADSATALPESITPIQDTSVALEIPHDAPQTTKPLDEKEVERTAPPQPRPHPQPKAQTPSFGLSLGHIAQGFMKSVQQEEGLNNPPQMDADKLVAHQYATKVWNIIKNSFKADENMLHLSQHIDTLSYLVITIAHNGRLIDIHLEGNRVNTAFKQIEALIVSHAKKAGLFPPLPKRFNVAQKTFTFPLRIQGQEGYHSYRMSYGPNR